jgi:purine nucleosidase
MKPVILDVDTGVDDALAIAYAARSPELELIALTTCFGNITVEEATRNSLKILELLGKDIPVVPGADKPLKREKKKEYARHVHGSDGLGNALRSAPAGKASGNNAAEFIIEQIKKRPHEITIISVGPLTNLALAIEQAPEIAGLAGEVIVMGGALDVPGNVTPAAEANVYSDPEAAELVLQSGIMPTLVGLDVTLKTLLPRAELSAWRAQNTEIGRFFAEMTEFYMDFYESQYPGIGGCALHDPLAVGVAVDRSFVRTVPRHVQVVTEGPELGRTKPSDQKANAQAAVEVDAERFVRHFLSRVL